MPTYLIGTILVISDNYFPCCCCHTGVRIIEILLGRALNRELSRVVQSADAVGRMSDCANFSMRQIDLTTTIRIRWPASLICQLQVLAQLHESLRGFHQSYADNWRECWVIIDITGAVL